MSENRILKFDLNPDDIQVKKMLNNDLLPIHICAVSSALPNNNGSNFNKESQELSLPSWDNKPVLGYFGSSPKDILTGDGPDFQAHNGGEVAFDDELEEYFYDYSKATDEKAIGLIIPGSAKVVYHEDDGLWWTECDALIWTKYNYKAVRNLLKSKRKTVSVEVEILASHEDENGYDIFEKYSLMGITILGDQVLPGITDAHLTVSSFSKTETFQKQMKVLSFACNKNLNQTKNNTELFSTEEDIYHTDNPQNPENEDWKEISFKDEEESNNDEDSNNSKQNNSRKDEKSQMNFSLSYNTRRELLDSALHEAVHGMYAGDNIWCYVNDFDESICYFYLEVEGSECGDWCAPYTLTLGSENGEEKVIDCNIDLSQKERVIREWKKLSENSETEGKTDMNKDVNSEKEKETQAQNFDDRGTEAPKSGDDRAVPAPKGGDDRGDPHTPATYEGSEENKDEAKKETEASDESKDDKAKETEACEDKETEACDDKETEAKDVTEVKSTPAGGDKKVTHVPSKSVSSEDDSDEGEKCDCSKDDSKEECAKNDSKEECSKEECAKDGEKEDECNYEAKFAQLSQDYVAMQKENETLKAVNAKFEADIADLMSKVSKFEAEKNEAVNTNLYNFGLNMINAEIDLSEDTRKTMSAELETECKASKFSSEDDVKKFTVTKIAMALYEARQAKKETMSQKESKKEEFVQTIIPGTSISKNENVDELTAKRNALEAI